MPHRTRELPRNNTTGGKGRGGKSKSKVSQQLDILDSSPIAVRTRNSQFENGVDNDDLLGILEDDDDEYEETSSSDLEDFIEDDEDTDEDTDYTPSPHPRPSPRRSRPRPQPRTKPHTKRRKRNVNPTPNKHQQSAFNSEQPLQTECHCHCHCHCQHCGAVLHNTSRVPSFHTPDPEIVTIYDDSDDQTPTLPTPPSSSLASSSATQSPIQRQVQRHVQPPVQPSASVSAASTAPAPAHVPSTYSESRYKPTSTPTVPTPPGASFWYPAKAWVVASGIDFDDGWNEDDSS